MCLHLGLEEPLGKDLEERFLRGEADIVLALGPVKAKTTTHASGQDHNTYLALTNKRSADRSQGGLLDLAHVNLARDELWLDRVKGGDSV